MAACAPHEGIWLFRIDFDTFSWYIWSIFSDYYATAFQLYFSDVRLLVKAVALIKYNGALEYTIYNGYEMSNKIEIIAYGRTWLQIVYCVAERPKAL